jgi:hypothetical protein
MNSRIEMPQKTMNTTDPAVAPYGGGPGSTGLGIGKGAKKVEITEQKAMTDKRFDRLTFSV